MLKRIAYARLAETAGPFSNEIDHALALFDFPRAAAAIYSSMPQPTKIWVEAFAAGFNHIMSTGKRPKDFGIFNLKPEPLTPHSIIAIGRVIGADINWGKYVELLKARREKPAEWQEYFNDALDMGYSNIASKQLALLEQISKSGSNSMAIAGARSATKNSLLISDPHLGFMLPNAWLLVGVKSPDLHAVGGMAPGLPFIAFGRNKHLAWGGTNMRSASSDLYSVATTDLLPAQKVHLTNRFWLNKTLKLRQSHLGPVISDHPWFAGRAGELIALRWRGHQVSDEISAFLALNRATRVQQVPQLMQDFAVSGQHLVVADDRGNIGHIPAVHLPQRPYHRPSRLVLDPKMDAWQGYYNSMNLSKQINPARGYVLSANDQPPFVSQALGYFFSVPDRTTRLTQLLDAASSIDLEQAKQIQADSLSPSAARLAAQLYDLLASLKLNQENTAFLQRLEGWNGDYAAAGSAPVVFETLLYHLMHEFYADTDSDEDELPEPYDSYAWQVKNLPVHLAKQLRQLSSNRVNTLIDQAREDAAIYPKWGDMHLIRVGPAYANLPYIGRLFKRYEFAASGSRQTLMKTNHDLVRAKHRANYGSQSRHISDLSNPDANYFALLGGQDGWLESGNYADQLQLWQNNEYIQLPLARSKIIQDFPWVSNLQPGTP